MSGTPSAFTLKLRGAFRLSDPQGRAIDVSSRKGMALLAMLAMADDGERTRTWLQDMLWGSRDPEQARGSLRRELSNLRKLLDGHDPQLLDTRRERVRLALERVQVDARAAAGPADREFLEGFDVPGEEGFEGWLRDQRRIQSDGATDQVRPPPELRAELAARVAAAARRPGIGVLRFESPTAGQDELYLAEGIAEEVISGLSRSRILSVSSRHSSLTIDARGADARTICERLGVDYLVQGQVRMRPGGTARVSVSLVNGAEDRTIWSEHYDRSTADLALLQDSIVAAIIGTLEPALLGHEEFLSVRSGSAKPGHWDLFIRGRWHFWRATFADWARAREFLTEAHALDPDDVPTLSHLALCNLGEVWGGAAKDPAANIAEAHRLALRAVSLDGGDAYAHYVLGTALSLLGRFDRAEAEQRRALELNPYLAAALGELGRLSVFAGRADEAIAFSDRAIAASPNDPHLFLWFRSKALADFIQGRFAEAARHAADACARSPHQFFLHYLLAACHAAAGDARPAALAIAEGQRLQPDYSEPMVRLAYPFADPAHIEAYLEALRKAGWTGGQG